MKCLTLGQFEDARTKPSVMRDYGEILDVEPASRVKQWVAAGVVRPLGEDGDASDYPWGARANREFPVEHPASIATVQLVACLNVWNDRPALELTVPTWESSVGRVIAVDGAYSGVPTGQSHGRSTDGTLDFLRAVFGERLLVVESAVGWWDSQLTKRNAYLSHAALAPGAYLLVIDADEFVTIHDAPTACDVGWVRVEDSKIYKRPYDQPRLFLWTPTLSYRGRHHWMYRRDELLCTHQYGGVGVDHRLQPISYFHERHLARPPARQTAKRIHQMAQVRQENTAVQDSDTADRFTGAREALHILQLGEIDPGFVIYRLHEAINATTPHTAIMGRHMHDNPLGGPTQWDCKVDGDILRVAARQADILHAHILYEPVMMFGGKQGKQKLVMHHHGTHYRQAADIRNALDAVRADVVLVSNVELLQYRAGNLHYLPNPVPFAQYAWLGAKRRSHRGTFRVAHSPSKRHLKGTDDLIAACARLRRRGLDVREVLIEKLSHHDALRLKATCHACFDSFWLGMQCSGHEAAAMGQPVIAGDPYVREQMIERYDYLPYTYANDSAALEEQLEYLVVHDTYYEVERDRVQTFVREHHDGASVVRQYLNILDNAFDWRAGALW